MPPPVSFGIRRRGLYIAFVVMMLALAIAVPIVGGTWWGVLVPLAIGVAVMSDMREAVTRLEVGADALVVQTFATSRRIAFEEVRDVALQRRRLFRGGTMEDVAVTLHDGETVWIKPRFTDAEVTFAAVREKVA